MDSNTNIMLVQKCFECFGRGDINGILALLAENVIWEEPENSDIPYAGKRQGKTAVRGFFESLEQIELAQFSPQEFIGNGDRVVVLGTWAGQVRSTGKSFQSDWALVWKIINGQVTQFKAYEDTATIATAFQH